MISTQAVACQPFVGAVSWRDSRRNLIAAFQSWALNAKACVEIKCHGASHDLHAIDATPARLRGCVDSSPLDGVSTAASSSRNDLVKNWVHATLVDFQHRRRRLRPRSSTPSLRTASTARRSSSASGACWSASRTRGRARGAPSRARRRARVSGRRAATGRPSRPRRARALGVSRDDLS